MNNILECVTVSTFIHYPQLSSPFNNIHILYFPFIILLTFIHFHPLLSAFYLFSSTSINFYPLSSTFIPLSFPFSFSFIHFHSLAHFLSFTFKAFHPLSTLIYFQTLSSTLSIFIHFIDFYPLSSTFIPLSFPFYPLPSTFTCFHKLSSTFIHFHPLVYTSTHFYPL